MMTEQEIGRLESQIMGYNIQAGIIEKEKRRLEIQLRKLKSLRFIEANSVTMDQIELSDGEDKPYFDHTSKFIDYIRKLPEQKRFAQWNGSVYVMSDFLCGRLPYENRCQIEDVPEAKGEKQ